jgi:hypothetical protein
MVVVLVSFILFTVSIFLVYLVLLIGRDAFHRVPVGEIFAGNPSVTAGTPGLEPIQLANCAMRFGVRGIPALLDI